MNFTPTVPASVLSATIPIVSVEAGSTNCWARFTGRNCRCIGIDQFGASAPPDVLFDHYGLTTKKIAASVRALIEGRK